MSSNQISQKPTKLDPIRSSQTWKKSDQIPKSYALQHIKTNLPKTTKSTNAMTEVMSGFNKPKDKTNSNALGRQKIRNLSKYVITV